MDQRNECFNLDWAAVAAAATGVVAASLFTVVELAGAPEPVRMPVTPHAMTVVAALAGALLALFGGQAGIRPPLRTVAGAACGAVLVAGCISAVPHTILTLLVWVGGRLTGGQGPFDVTPAWLASAANLAGVAAAGCLLIWLVVDRRRARGRCVACGRVNVEPDPARWRSLPVWAGLAMVGALPYGVLKLCWASGVPVGLTGHAFDEVTFTSPGFGDTVVLTGVGLAVAVGMGRRLRGRLLRPVLVTVGVIGSLMLLPVAATALAYVLQVVLGLRGIDDQEIAPWAFLVVYSSFAVWGVALTVLTIGYVRTTRSRCMRHHVSQLQQHTESGGSTASVRRLSARL